MEYAESEAVANAWAKWTTVHTPAILRRLEGLEALQDQGMLPEGVPLKILASQRRLVIQLSAGGALAPTAATSKAEGHMIVELYCRAVSYIAGFVRFATATAVAVNVKEEAEFTYTALVAEWKTIRRGST